MLCQLSYKGTSRGVMLADLEPGGGASPRQTTTNNNNNKKLRGSASKMVEVGFEPTPPKRLELESSALDHSAIQPVKRKGPIGAAR